MDKIEQLQGIIDQSQRIVFFGGAGVSTESNIPDFRSSDGIYSLKLGRHFTAEQLVSRTMFERYPEDFFDFYKKYLVYPDAKPNLAHDYLASLEKTGKLKAIVTQNIDSLHEMAGSQKVLKLHGSADRNYCLGCHRFYDLTAFLALEGPVPHCLDCGKVVKPDVTLYEEELDMEVRTLANIKSAIKRAELNVKQNEKNSAQKSAMRTAIKAFEANPSEELFRAASSAIDKAETKGLIHKNKASRDKARLSAKLAK